MSTITDMRDRYIEAELAILQGQSIDFGVRRLTLADLAEVREGRKEWERRAAAERGGSMGAVVTFSGIGGREGSERRWGRN